VPQIGTLPVVPRTSLRRRLVLVPLRRAVGPTLTDAWVTFYTNDEDKDLNQSSPKGVESREVEICHSQNSGLRHA
jgi:hypothetical protein